MSKMGFSKIDEFCPEVVIDVNCLYTINVYDMSIVI